MGPGAKPGILAARRDPDPVSSADSSHHPPTHLRRSRALRVAGLPPARSLASINTFPKDSGFICFSWRGAGGAGVPPSPPLLPYHVCSCCDKMVFMEMP